MDDSDQELKQILKQAAQVLREVNLNPPPLRRFKKLTAVANKFLILTGEAVFGKVQSNAKLQCARALLNELKALSERQKRQTKAGESGPT